MVSGQPVWGSESLAVFLRLRLSLYRVFEFEQGKIQFKRCFAFGWGEIIAKDVRNGFPCPLHQPFFVGRRQQRRR